MTDSLAPWPMLHQNPQHTARGRFPGPLQYQQSWSITVGGKVSSGIAVDASGNLYFGADDNVFYCLNAQGVTQWTYKSAYPFISGPPIVGAGGVVYAASDRVMAFASGGQLLWTYTRQDIGMVVMTPMTLSSDGSVLYVVADSSTGQQDRLVALKSSDGVALWEMKFGAHSQSAPALGSDGTIYVGCDDHKLYAVKPGDGSLKWSYDAGGMIRSSPAIDAQGNIYFARMTTDPQANMLIALKPDGTVLWQYAGGGYMGNTASPAIGADGTIYMGFYGLHAVTPSGTKKWATSTTNNVGIYPGYIGLSSDGNIYFGTQDKKLYGYDANGNLLWQGVGSDTSAPAIGGNGRLYASAGTNAVFAIQSIWQGNVTISLDQPLYWLNQLQKGVYLRYTIQQPLPSGSYVLTFARPGQPPDVRYTIPFSPRSGSGAIYLSASNPALPWSSTPPRDGQYAWTILMGTVSGTSFTQLASTTITIAPPPQLQSVVYNGSQVRASWAANSVAGAAGYMLQVAASDGSYKTSTTLANPSATSGTLPVSLLDTTKTFNFSLCLLGPNDGRSCGAGVQLLTTIPVVTLVSYEITAVKATWQQDAESGITSLLLNVTEADGSQPQNVTINDPTATSGQIPLSEPLDASKEYLFNLLTQKAGAVSVGASSRAIPLLVQAPQNVELQYDYVAKHLVAQWQAVTLPYLTVTGYSVELFKDGSLLVSQTTNQTTCTFQQDLVDESVFQVMVQALGATVAGPYSPLASAPFAYTISYTYDSLSRIHTLTRQGTTIYTYTLDKAGNIETAECVQPTVQSR